MARVSGTVIGTIGADGIPYRCFICGEWLFVGHIAEHMRKHGQKEWMEAYERDHD